MRRLFIGTATVLPATVLRIQTETFDGEGKPPDERYLISSLPSVRSTPLSSKTITLGLKPAR